MELEEIRNKYQCDEGRTFAQWKEWVRKNKPSQAETHIITAVAPNGSKFEKLIGGYTDAQNNAFDLVAHGYKNVKMFKSVNAGPMKLLRNFSAPLHGAKFKDSADSVDSIRQKYANDGFLNVDKETRRKIISYLKTRWKLDDAKTNRFIRDFDRDLGDLVKDKEPWDRITKFIDGRVKKIDVNPYSNSYGHSLIAQKYKKPGKDKLRSKDSEDEVDEIRNKYQSDAVGAGVVNPNFKFQTNVEKRLATTRKGRAMTLPQYSKPSKIIVKKDGDSFSVIGKDGQKLNKKTFKSYEEAEKWARGNGWMVERR